MTERLAYVTGGMGGIGTSISRRLHKDGYTVVAGLARALRAVSNGLRNKRRLGTISSRPRHVGDWDSTQKAFDKVKAEVGEIDILVNNAGITRDGVFRKMTHEDWTAASKPT